jgi:hypothetical protein
VQGSGLATTLAQATGASPRVALMGCRGLRHFERPVVSLVSRHPENAEPTVAPKKKGCLQRPRRRVRVTVNGMGRTNAESSGHGRVIFAEAAIVLLAAVSSALLVFEIVSDATAEQRHLLEQIDVLIALIFLMEFVIRLWRAESKLQFLRHSGWEILASIPITSDMARALRALRMLRVVR